MPKIEYVPKRYDDQDQPWVAFGAPNQDEYEKWSPEVCAICCLKMIGDYCGSTNVVSLYQLAMECKQKGGYRELPNGEIQGVFHKPLLELAGNYGLAGQVEGSLDTGKIIAFLQNNKFVILSINKAKVNPNLSGGHMILVHAYNPASESFSINDPEPILDTSGQNIIISSSKLAEISNRKGLVVWKA